MRPPEEPATGATTYPPPVYTTAEDHRSVPPAGIFWWAGSTILLGAVIGVLWWLLAPTGKLFGDPMLAEQWVLRDLTLVALELVAGIAVGSVVAARLGLPGVMARVLAAVGGSMLGSGLALGVGEGLAWVLGPEGREDVQGTQFVLQSYGALLIWPATAALIIFATALIGLARRRT